MHLDRALARGDRGLACVRLGCRCGDRRLRVVFGDAPGGPVGERPRELQLEERVCELVRDRLIDTDRPPELLARLRVLDAELERAVADPERLGRQRRQRARPQQRGVAGERRPVLGFEPPEPARPIHRLDDFAPRGDRARVAVLDHGHAIDDPEIGHERAVERRRPAHLAGRDLRLLVRPESRQREAFSVRQLPDPQG